MKKGLVIGKFMPPHKGHLALIDFAIQRSGKLTVAVCSRPEEPIPGKLRLEWMKKLLGKHENIRVIQIKANLPQGKGSSRPTSKVWGKYLLKRLGKIDVIFSSEKYGDYLAEYMKTEHMPYDPKRKAVPISATKIRKNPLFYWDYIPEIVRPYFVKKICIYGPESTGKTTLAKQLAKHFKTTWIPEYARVWIEKNGFNFKYKDIERFGRGQVRIEKKACEKANRFLFCDTDSITTSIYSRTYFGKVPALVKKLAERNRFDLYLFTEIDLPWKKDKLRDLGHKRREMRDTFKQALIERDIPFEVVKGKGQKRLRVAIRAINKRFDL
jgi:HTH-type transcriptional regulator, transcriptional repressor of NAD biosynthesis genes